MKRMIRVMKSIAVKRKITLAGAIFLLIALSTNASAIIPAIIAILAGGGLVAEFVGGILAGLNSLFWAISFRLIYAELLKQVFYSRLADAIDKLPFAVMMNPNYLTESGGKYVVSPAISDLVNMFIGLTIPVYVLAVAFTGFYLIFVSSSPLGRARAKSTLIKLIVSMAVGILTIPLIQLLLDISEHLTGMIFDQVDVSAGLEVIKNSLWAVYANFWDTMVFSYWNAIYLFMFTGIMFALIFMLLGIRFFLVIFFTAIFPVTVFFYAFYYTRRAGEQLFKETIAWIFMQPLIALILVGISVAASAMPMPEDATAVTCFGLAGCMILIILPLMAAHIMDWMAMLMIMLTGVEFPGMHGLIGIVDELQIEGPEVEEITAPPPIRPH